MYDNTGILCPGCGNTRCVKALLSGNILLAIRSNITIPFLGLLLILLYIELLFDLSGKKVHLLPRNGIFWGIVIAAFFAYFIIRNFIDGIAPI